MVAAILVLLLIAGVDWHCRRIPNELALVLLVTAFFANAPHWQTASILANIVIGLLLTLPGYFKGILGGGDVKLLVAFSPLLSPMMYLASFASGILILSGALLLFKRHQTRLSSEAACADKAKANPIELASEQFADGGLPVGTALFFGVLATLLWNTLLFN